MKRTHSPARRVLLFFLAALCCLFLASTVSAAPKRVNQWYVNKKGRVLYYDHSGKKATGLTKIKGKTYYFDKKGFQHVGWQKIDGDYYFFRISTKSKAYMITREKINGIKLTKSGRPSKKASKRKLALLCQANKVVERITQNSITTEKMSKREKLRACFDYMLENYTYCAVRTFVPETHWDYTFAEDIFNRERGDCVSFAAAYAYLANALGYKASSVCSGGHAWTEIGNYFFDPTWALVTGQPDLYFRNHYRTSGQNGRPLYAQSRQYVIPV